SATDHLRLSVAELLADIAGWNRPPRTNAAGFNGTVSGLRSVRRLALLASSTIARTHHAAGWSARLRYTGRSSARSRHRSGLGLSDALAAQQEDFSLPPGANVPGRPRTIAD